MSEAGQSKEPEAPAAPAEDKPSEKARDENVDSWVKDDVRARDAAGFGPMLEQASNELSGLAGGPPGGLRSGVWIIGDVHVAGDMLGGDKPVGERRPAFAGEVIAGRVATTVLEQIEKTYVSPPVHGRLQELLRDHCIAILRAPSGWGRTTTGLHVLAELCARTVHKLNPDTRLHGLKADKDLRAGYGHLLEIRAVDQLDGLKVPHLEELSAVCRDRDMWLLVTVDDDIGIDDDVHADFAVIGGERPDLDIVLRRHLETRLEDFGVANAAASAAQMLADAKVQEILGRFVNDTLSMRRIAELADRLSLSFQGGIDFAAIETYFEELSETNFSQWFDSVPDSGRPFIIALAALNGMSYAVVMRAARELQDRIHAVETEVEKARGSVFGSSRARRLADARARITATTSNTRYGPVRTDGVRFHNDGYPRRVLERVWREYDDVRPVILEWLRTLGGDRNRAIRIRAAAAAGLIATIDFDQIHHEVLLRWADSDDAHVRESAVSALRFPVTQSSELAVHVIRMMRDWSGPHSPPNRQWTASRALGASIGRSIRSEALRLLRRMAARDDLALSFAVADSVMELFLDTEEKAQSDVLAALLRWTSDTAPAIRRSTGTLCFLRLALHVDADDPDEGAIWPGLLWFAARQADDFDRLSVLWNRALAAPAQFMTAQSALTDWVTMADGEPRIIEALEHLLTRTIHGRYDVGRITEAIEQSAAEHGATDATRSLLATIAKLEKKL